MGRDVRNWFGFPGLLSRIRFLSLRQSLRFEGFLAVRFEVPQTEESPRLAFGIRQFVDGRVHSSVNKEGPSYCL
jgi:hypothetical protein